MDPSTAAICFDLPLTCIVYGVLRGEDWKICYAVALMGTARGWISVFCISRHLVMAVNDKLNVLLKIDQENM